MRAFALLVVLALVAPGLALAARTPTGEDVFVLTPQGSVLIHVEYADGVASTRVGFAQLEGAAGGPDHRLEAGALCTDWRGTFTQVLIRARPEDAAVSARALVAGFVAAPGEAGLHVRDSPGFVADLLGGPGAFRGSLIICDSPSGRGNVTLNVGIDTLPLAGQNPALVRLAGEPAAVAASQRFADVAAAGGLVLPAPGELPRATLRDAILAHYALVGAVPTEAGLAELDARLARVPISIQAPVATMLASMNEAAATRAAVFADVSVEDARFARDATLSGRALSPTEEARLELVLARLDLPAMAAAGARTLAAVEEARASLALAVAEGETASFVDPLGSIEIADVGDDEHVSNRTLLVDLGGDDDWSNNAGAAMPDFVIEAFPGCIVTLGLDCTALSAGRNDGSLESVFGRTCSAEIAGAAFEGAEYLDAVDAEVRYQTTVERNVPRLTALVLDSQNHARDAAETADPDTGCLPQGADDAEAWSEDFLTKGILTDGDEHVVAVALDLSGDDRFAPDLVFNDINDGDNAASCDTRALGDAGRTWERNVTAGSAFAGIGILWDDDGNDFYGGRSVTQAVGHVGGIGVLVDRGADRDEYSAVRFGQGTAFFAAMGVLLDDGGDDRYALENDAPFFNEFENFIGCDVSTRDGQGRANFNAIAALVDEAGDDVYHVDTHAADVPGASRDDPLTTQGSTGARLNVGPSAVADLAALGRGMLWDRAGADAYTREGRGDGVTDPEGTFIDDA